MEFVDTENKSKGIFGSPKILLTPDIITSQGNKIRLVDSDINNNEHLDLYCYVRCNNQEKNIIKSCRGVIINNEKILLQTFGYSCEYVLEDKEIDNLFEEDIENLKFFDSHEGSLIRVFNFNNKWYVSTHRKLDAYRSKWSSKVSFGQQFNDALKSEYENNEDFQNRLNLEDKTEKDDKVIKEKFFETLDKDFCYCFLVRNTNENRIVCQPLENPKLYHVATFDKKDFSLSLEDSVDIPYPKELSFDSWDKFREHVNNIDEDHLQGVIIFKNDIHVKVLNSEYKKLFDIRGNEPSIKQTGIYREPIQEIPLEEEIEDEEDKKRELLFKFELLKKSYKNSHAEIPEFTVHSDYNNMKKVYDHAVKKLSLDTTIENYKTYLIGGFMIIEYIFGNWLSFDMQGFTQQQIMSMNSYEKLLIELGEKSYIPESKQWPVEIRLLFLIIINAAFFIISKMILRKTGSNLMSMFNSMNTANTQEYKPKRKMRGPNINLDEIPEYKEDD